MADQLGAVARVLDSVYDDVDDLADMSCRGGKAQLFGHIEEALGAIELDVLGNLAVHPSRLGPLLP